MKGKGKEIKDTSPQITNGKINAKTTTTTAAANRPLLTTVTNMELLAQKASFALSLPPTKSTGSPSTSTAIAPTSTCTTLPVADANVNAEPLSTSNPIATSVLPAPKLPPSYPFIEEFTRKVKALPRSIPTAPKTHVLAQYAGYTEQPQNLTKDIPDEDLWKEFDTGLTNLIPNGAVETRTHLVMRGKYGLAGLVGLVRHLAYDRRMDCVVLEPKLERLIQAIDVVTARAGAKQPNKTATAQKKKRFQIPINPISPKHVTVLLPCRVVTNAHFRWLYVADWQNLSENKGKSADDFEAHWAEFEKQNKDELERYKQLSREKNSEASLF
ncbi:hypothetical protein E1B28_010949 [Marasmius oreades]|uniref:Uncharacterized protein n=1 Tax=Marasmius oreades TaxID=181124 RepID=A0A9P7RT72_9AGAR|nr:uncharacterized protein E1B28_010949 [Marasmius oreades]KAG7089250.1 hypothetical protein E1B28_010949 [Marasmius oreades]